MQSIKTFEDACKQLGIDPETVFNETDTKDERAYKKLKIITKALNGDWTPNWTDRNEWKYYPWFDLSSGSGLRCTYYDGQGSGSGVGSRLCFISSEVAEYAGKTFKKLYEQYFLLK